MFVNVAYLKNVLESYLTPVDCADDSVPLKILCCGYYHVAPSDEVIDTNRPNGRKDYQLLYFHNGQGHFYFDGASQDAVTVSAGQMVLFRPGERQVYKYYGSDLTEVYWIHFTGSEAENILAANGFSDCGQVFQSGISIEYQELWLQMIRELQLCKKGYEKLLALLLQNLLLLVNRNRAAPTLGTATVEREMNAALRYFNEHYSAPIQVEEYAASHYMSPCWFIRSFKQYTGFTPLQYIISVRMTNARDLLSGQERSVSEVAAMVGYEDALYFSRLFKRHTGVTPMAYRQAMRAGNADSLK